VLGLLDDDVLEEIAKTGFDGALVPALDLKVVGDGALLVHLPVRLCENGTRGVAVFHTRGLELPEGGQTGVESRKLVLAATNAPGTPLVLDPRACER
jgi:hypothetical protein